jgi:hypothetical protein
MKTRSLLTVLAIAALLASVATSVAANAANGAGGPKADRYVPVVMSVLSTPHWFEGSDGKFSVVYELQLVNGFPSPVTVKGVTVKDGTGKRLATLKGAALKASMTPMADPTQGTNEVQSSAIDVVWMQLQFDRRAEIPRRIEHVLTVSAEPGLPVPPSITSVGAEAKVDPRPPVKIGPPLVGDNWVAVGSCCDGPHRRALQPVNGSLSLGQRFAIDWNGMDAQDRFVVGDPDVNASWSFFGKPVIAVAAGTVVAAVDRFPDQVPNHPKAVTLPEADGNHVILKLGPHLYAGFAHLERGSVAVKVGDKVKKGQLLGLLGNSGSSSGPHLHFQVMDAPSMVDANGLPFAFESFTEVGKIPPLTEALAEKLAKGEPTPVDRQGAGPRSDELPLGRDVVDFP